MNDRFKFRVWDKENKGLRYPTRYNNFSIVNGTVVKIESYPTANSAYLGKRIAWEFDDAVIMQCTGLKDKNGKLIYEGDIINIWCKNLTKNQISDVFYCEERAAFCFHYETDYGNIVPCTMDKTEIEIIGNIYENKELLESEE